MGETISILLKISESNVYQLFYLIVLKICFILNKNYSNTKNLKN